jgi:hypothetical protein
LALTGGAITFTSLYLAAGALAVAVADGRNDIELLSWASERGRGVAMCGSPADVIEAACELTGTVDEDGLAQVLATLSSSGVGSAQWLDSALRGALIPASASGSPSEPGPFVG